MTTNILLNMLDKVKQTNPQTWVARCPAHEDHSPSLSIRELPEGKILIHCFSGCDPYSIVNSVGLTIGDLFPDQVNGNYQKPIVRKITASQAFELTYFESLVIKETARTILNEKILSDKDYERLNKAFDRINNVHLFYGD